MIKLRGESMYICSCQGITEKQLQSASRGRGSVNEILQRLNIGKDCGGCLEFAVAAYLKYQGIPPQAARQSKCRRP